MSKNTAPKGDPVSSDAGNAPAASPAQRPQDPPSAPVPAVTVRVLAAVTIGDARYQPDDVIEGLPADIAEQNAASVDANDDAVAFAVAQGAAVKVFSPAE